MTEEVDLPVGVAAGLGGQGFEGVTGYGTGDDAVLYAAVQRASSTCLLYTSPSPRD